VQCRYLYTVQQAAVNGKRRRRKFTQSVRDEDDSSTSAALVSDHRFDCCSVLTHEKTHIQGAANTYVDVVIACLCACKGSLIECSIIFT